MMNRKLLLPALLIAISVLGILAFQVDWLLKTYDYEIEKTHTKIDSALKKAVNQLNIDSRQKIKNEIYKNFSSLVDSVKVEFSPEGDLIDIYLNNQVRFKEGLYGIERMEYSVGNVTINFPMYDEFPPQMLKELGVLVRAGEKQFVNRLDQMMKPYQATGDSIVFKKDSLGISNSLKRQLSSSLFKRIKLGFFQDNAIRMGKVRAAGNIVHQYSASGLYAYIGEPRWVLVAPMDLDSYIFSQMMFGIGLTFLLLLTMLFAFFNLWQVIARQRKLAEMKDDFINNLSHEFKTPIATVAAAIESLQHFNASEDPNKVKYYLEVSKQQVARLDEMVGRVLELASIGESAVQLKKQAIDLQIFINDLIPAWQMQTDRRIFFDLNFNHGCHDLFADPFQLKIMFNNLIENAINYTDQEPHIRIATKINENYFTISIADQGIGISKSDQIYIFEKFFRVHKGNLYYTKGIGLGLHQVKNVVEAHNGTIEVESDGSSGTTFTIIFPVND